MKTFTLYILVLVILFTSVHYAEHQNIKNKNFVKRNIEFATILKNQFNNNLNYGQYLIFTENFTHTAYGFNHWNTHFLRELFNETNIIGLITHSGSKQTNCPFVKQYKHHDKSFWAINKRNNLQYRKNNIGLEVGRSTKIIYAKYDIKNNVFNFTELDHFYIYLKDIDKWIIAEINIANNKLKFYCIDKKKVSKKYKNFFNVSEDIFCKNIIS